MTVSTANPACVAATEVDTRYKFVVALKGKLPPGVAANAASHLCLGLAAKAATEQPDLLRKMSFLGFPDADGGRHAPISGLSLVVLAGRPAWVRRLRDQADASGLLYTDFTAEMTGDTYAEQLDRMQTTSEQGLDYYGIALFGLRDELDPLTKKFSLLN
ncbi:DUF2000 domain-containing protein [Streptomyces luteolus]|uniref:DUF2000 domain-containing protein n=1 Tax=Streptomyces luteolus TaxID=3043615 RepID=A0ABT6SQU8_9ACTN|nr:DUF2000 domain-containing protein [Streptomyces sp. B-S-A12]MDI3417625.1 DUF2000 domain-containing protein [Streptomyces sp. B-S-A12]